MSDPSSGDGAGGDVRHGQQAVDQRAAGQVVRHGPRAAERPSAARIASSVVVRTSRRGAVRRHTRAGGRHPRRAVR
ncbi:hypothetical protein [Kocuria arenosa]|uniref:hypothetical protein n=1 Tax=Kocuria arenosa TaxID=3071446 RepID=UPI0034D5860C